MNNSSHSTWSEPESELTEANRRLIRTIREQYQRRTKRLNYFHQISQASMETRPPPTITDNMLKPHHPAARIQSTLNTVNSQFLTNRTNPSPSSIEPIGIINPPRITYSYLTLPKY
ncbi:hypothetical protein Pst134EA_017156 [Puccinia striiformis f. sp. tritici]|uniref:hypothetical protein n=1 Tax=Puccinia striiformis f. sp. tritici TaxID=168172 RepID=UPI0020084E40|nr:hypothetical protein Pst134EA_017156 [Puccinia striiformis f. sp. tritici]KAH9460841.1 hypothetical protein Pst134EA_017156 [Puccinia striiformis f. sp. tritici]